MIKAVNILIGCGPNWGSSMHLIKTDANGGVQWSKLLNTGCYSGGVPYSVRQTADGGYIATGPSVGGSFGSGCVFLLYYKRGKFPHGNCSTPLGSYVYSTMIFYKHRTPSESNQNAEIPL